MSASFDDSALLRDRVAVITGGAAGIGRGIVELYLEHGARVAVIDVDTADLDTGTMPAGARLLPIRGDVREGDDVDAAVAAVLDRWGRIDVLVNNVGHFLFPGRSFVDTTEEEWQALYSINLGQVFRVTHAVLPTMITRGAGGSIINVSTVEAFRGIPQHPVYAACKAGVTQFGKSLALDLGRHGIRVNDIAPDVTRSQQLPYERWLDDDDRARIPTWVPLGRLGEPRDPAGVALFLASDLAAFVTGTTIHCDGGTWAAGGWYRSGHDGRGWTNRPRDP